VREAEAVGNKTAAEQLTIDRMKAAAAQRAGDMGTAIAGAGRALPARSAAGEAGPDRRTAGLGLCAAAQQRQGHRVAEQGHRRGQQQRHVKQLQSYLQGASGDYAAIARDAGGAVSAAEQAGRRPSEGDLLRLADAQQRTGNNAGYSNTLEKLLTYYPKKDYWNAYLAACRASRASATASRWT
jgi:hypothetical protein